MPTATSSPRSFLFLTPSRCPASSRPVARESRSTTHVLSLRNFPARTGFLAAVGAEKVQGLPWSKPSSSEGEREEGPTRRPSSLDGDIISGDQQRSRRCAVLSLNPSEASPSPWPWPWNFSSTAHPLKTVVLPSWKRALLQLGSQCGGDIHDHLCGYHHCHHTGLPTTVHHPWILNCSRTSGPGCSHILGVSI